MAKIAILVVSVSVAVMAAGVPYYPPPLPVECITPPYTAFGSHNLFVGCVRPYDKLLYSQTIIKSEKWFQGRAALIKYPLPGYWRNEIISGIWIFDKYRNGTGGYPHIISGGVGRRNVTIQLNSKPFRGFNFDVSIYGR